MTKSGELVKRRDATGHLDPKYGRDLLAKAREGRSADGEVTEAFISGTESAEELSEELGEAFLESATSGEQSQPERLDRVTSDELGGPFVVSSARREFAEGTDDSNVAGATREPLPRTSKAEP